MKNEQISHEQLVNEVLGWLSECKSRIELTNRVLAKYAQGRSVTGYRQCDVELCFLNLRKCCELIMFASISANRAAGVELRRKIAEDAWNADRILSQLKAVNPKFKIIPQVDDGVTPDGILKVKENTGGALTFDGFSRLYNKICGRWLHANRSGNFNDSRDEDFKLAYDYVSAMMKLIGHCWIYGSDEIVLSVIMSTKGHDQINVAIAREVGRPE